MPEWIRGTEDIFPLTCAHFHNADARLRVFHARLRVSHARLRVSAVRLRVSAVRLRVSAARLRVSAVRLRVSAVRLRVSAARLRVSHACLWSSQSPGRGDYIGLATGERELALLSVVVQRRAPPIAPAR